MDAKAALERAIDELARQRAEIDSLRRDRTDPIAVVGMACRFPGGADTPAAFWDLLDRGVDAVTEVPRDRWNADAFYDADPSAAGKMTTRCGAFIGGADRFDPQFFGISPREAQSMDPQQRILLEVVWEAFENANIPPATLYGSPTGVFIGITCFDHAIRLSQSIEHFGSYAGTGSALNMAAGRVSYVFGLTGPSMAVDTACSSSLVGLHLACQSLRQRESNVALAGGVHLMLSPDVMVSFSQARMLAADGRSKTFDASADGYSRGEGCGVVVLKRYADAVADRNTILGLIRGTAVNQDGPSGGLTVPNGRSQQEVMRSALASAGVAPGDVTYVEAHGTGTSLGDPIEVEALAHVYGKDRVTSDPLLIGSIKTNIGHLEPASGVAGLIKILLSFEHGRLPRHLHLRTPNPHIAWNTLPVNVVANPVDWPRTKRRRIAGLSAFGFSGTNAHVVVEEPPPAAHAALAPLGISPGPHGSVPWSLFTLSAKSEEGLTDAAARSVEFLHATPAPDVVSVCYTAGSGRTHFPYRLAIVAAGADDLCGALQALVAGRASAQVFHGKASSADYRRDARALETHLSRLYAQLREHRDSREPLDELAKLYVEGASIDWETIHGPEVPARIALPNYPFQRQRYWVETKTGDDLNAAEPADLYRIVWEKVGASADPGRADPARRFAVVSGGGGLADAVNRVLRECGASSVVVGSRDALSPVISSSTDVVFLNGPLSSPQDAAGSCAALLALVQDLLRARRAVRVWIVTRGAVAVHGALDLDRVAQAPLGAFAKVIGLEHPELFGRLIDIDVTADADDARALVGELLRPGRLDGEGLEDHVAIRLGERYAPRIERIDRATKMSDAPPAPVRADAIYLITGGLGALGLHAAAWLADRGARHLCLLGRTARSTWTATSHAKPLDALRALDDRGVHVRTAAVDVADRDALAALLRELGGSAPPLRGVVHAAGVPGYADIEHLTRDEVYAVLRPKVHGAWTLHELTRDIPLDFFVAFSSIASAWGSRGQAHYAAGSAFLDGLAHARRTAGLPAVSINWGPWAEGGMNSADAETLLRRVGVRPLATGGAVAALNALAAADSPQVIVADIDWRLFRGSYEARGHRRLLERLDAGASPVGVVSAVSPVGPVSHVPASGDRALAAQIEAAPKGDRERLLIEIVQTEVVQVLGLPPGSRPDPDQGLFEMGMDSLMALELRTRLETRVFSALPATLVFDCPAIRAVARFLLQRLMGPSAGDAPVARMAAPRQRQTIDLSAPSFDVNDLSDEDAEALLLDKLTSLE